LHWNKKNDQLETFSQFMTEQVHHHALPAHNFLDWLPLLIVSLAALTYSGLAIWNGKKTGWGAWRTLSFITGAFLLGIAMLPSVMQWAHSDLRGHMVQHLLIGMFAPIFLVLGAPITLALKSMAPPAGRAVTRILRSGAFFYISHPVTAFTMNMGGMYLLYLTPLYVLGFSLPFLHHLMHVHFLFAGFLFTWSIIGTDPAPERPAHLVRLIVLFISIASHAFLSKYMYAYGFPRNSHHSAEEIREAAKIMYYWGDLSELLLTIIFFAVWYLYPKRTDKVHLKISFTGK
jgi:putative membrane protein